jgi:glucose-1-phosphate cytidylyltransferase
VKPTVAILCGGRGTRLQEHARELPKPLVEIGGRPILWHVIQIYVAQGFDDFLLLTGHLSKRIEEFVAVERWPSGVRVRCRYTGQDTPTGGRVAAAAEELGSGTFCLTYADGLADVDLDGVLHYHRQHGAAATMTIVRPRLPFGVAQLNGDGVVQGFVEKPVSEHWVNGGFFCLEPSALERLTPDSVLEREPLAGLATAGQLRAFRHTGFWACMDTYKDALELEDLWDQGGAPWKRWSW